MRRAIAEKPSFPPKSCLWAFPPSAVFARQELFLRSAIKEAFEILSAAYFKLGRGVIDEKTINVFFDKRDVLDDTLNLIIRKFKNRGIKCSREKDYSATPQSGSSVVLAVAVPVVP